MANFNGNFLPCMLLGDSTKLKDGYSVYFFHIQEEWEIPARMIIGNLKALMHFEISFLDDDGQICAGRVRGTDRRSSETGEPANFFVCRKDTKECVWVSFPFIFLDKKQARALCCY